MKSSTFIFLAFFLLVVPSVVIAQTEPLSQILLNAKCSIPPKSQLESWLKKKFKVDLESAGLKKVSLKVKIQELQRISLVESVDLFKIFESIKIAKREVICVKAPCPALIEFESEPSEHIANIEQCLYKVGVNVNYKGVREGEKGSAEPVAEKVTGKLSTELQVPGSLVPKTK